MIITNIYSHSRQIESPSSLQDDPAYSLTSSHSLASLTEYMLQPVQQYSMLSFHDYYQEEGLIIIMLHQIPKTITTWRLQQILQQLQHLARRWLLRITTSHTHRSQSSHKQKRGEEQPEAMWTIYFLIPQSWATATAKPHWQYLKYKWDTESRGAFFLFGTEIDEYVNLQGVGIIFIKVFEAVGTEL